MALAVTIADADELPPRICPRPSKGGAIALALLKTPEGKRMAIRLEKSPARRVAATVAELLRGRGVGVRSRYDAADSVLWLWRDAAMRPRRAIRARGPIIAARAN